MTVVAAPPQSTASAAPASATYAFAAILRRDVYVTWHEFPVFLAQVILQPLFLLFVFGKVLGSLGYTRPGYAELLFPGLLALTAVVTAIQSLAFPLVAEFSWTMEIEDRLLAPLPVDLVAVEKMVYAALRALTAAGVMLPIGVLVLGSIPWRASAAPLFFTVIVLGALVGSAMGLLLGTVVQPARINVVFALVFTPLLFTGASQYPWPSLSRLPWFQVVTAFNPLTYVSEGLRGALVPRVPHMRPVVCVMVLTLAVVAFGWAGILGFRRRALD